jgi:Uma2 family endonuclease
MHLATYRKFTPDVLLVSQDRVPSPLPTVWEDAADLVVEILSESTRAYDLGEKRQAYHEAGISEIWFVDDDHQQIRVDRKGEQGYTEEVKHEGKLSSQVIQGFWIEVSWLWQEPLPPLDHCLQAIRSSC